jgi:hypothetical protein
VIRIGVNHLRKDIRHGGNRDSMYKNFEFLSREIAKENKLDFNVDEESNQYLVSPSH